nr:hypothetical protein [Halobacterium sp. CBA1126]
MKLVIDANVVISALIAGSKTRELIVALESGVEYTFLDMTSDSKIGQRTESIENPQPGANHSLWVT